MNLDQLFIPARLAPLFTEVVRSKSNENDLNGEPQYCVPESLLVAMFVEMGGKYEGFSGKNESVSVKMNKITIDGSLNADNQIELPVIPKELMEVIVTQPGNRIRAIMEYRDLSLKEVAERYGGKSAAANIANFLSRSDEELTHMRASTRAKLARALDCPIEWLQ